MTDEKTYKRVSDQITQNHENKERREEIAGLLRESGFPQWAEMDIKEKP